MGLEDHTLFDEWWSVVQKDEFVDGTKNMGWLRIAWTYSFYFLKNWPNYLQNNEQQFEKWLQQKQNANTQQ